MLVATRKWVPEPSDMGRENAICKTIITVIISVSLHIYIIWLVTLVETVLVETVLFKNYD